MEQEHDLAKWLAGEMTEQERIAFEKTPEFSSYEKIARYSQQLETPGFDQDMMYQNVIAAKKPKVISLKRSHLFLRVAAVLVVGLGIWFAMRQSTPEKFYADAGKQTAFELPDHSEVILNAGSNADFDGDDWADHRKLNLNGEAFFKVAKGKKFDVITTAGTVTVVGTQFNVRSRENRFEVSCFEGKVRVQCGTNTILITKGQKVAFEDGNAVAVPANTAERPEWMDGEMAFAYEKLDGIAAEMERQYNIKIKIDPGVSQNQTFIGLIPSNRLDTALEIISKTFGIHYKKNGKSEIILERND
ncbi:MAG: iron dicitrate transport regulator FecR [Flavobacterium sp. BFFFF1]|uniref:FecR family protein n=1 Tax=unclassified Flavobacterium TaxID=196869 RepID=UPI000BDBE1A0|nr:MULTISPECIES: FecR domain-containing protein [unclassified Flavobacterium]OYU80599.1 MAG: iron dicitrate transport regulator FecR [Flavobacterium sp. BFFFF1]